MAYNCAGFDDASLKIAPTEFLTPASEVAGGHTLQFNKF
jgi:hypothetical protein